MVWDLWKMSIDENTPVIIIGNSKPALNYITAIITLFNKGCPKIRVRARGKAITHAVEVVQLLRTSFVGDVEIDGWKIDKETIKTENGESLNLPVLELQLARSHA
jgi:DNA-binding protein